MDVILQWSDIELRQFLIDKGVTVGPVTATTRELYRKKAFPLLKKQGPSVATPPQPSARRSSASRRISPQAEAPKRRGSTTRRSVGITPQLISSSSDSSESDEDHDDVSPPSGKGAMTRSSTSTVTIPPQETPKPTPVGSRPTIPAASSTAKPIFPGYPGGVVGSNKKTEPVKYSRPSLPPTPVTSKAQVAAGHTPFAGSTTLNWRRPTETYQPVVDLTNSDEEPPLSSQTNGVSGWRSFFSSRPSQNVEDKSRGIGSQETVSTFRRFEQRTVPSAPVPTSSRYRSVMELSDGDLSDAGISSPARMRRANFGVGRFSRLNDRSGADESDEDETNGPAAPRRWWQGLRVNIWLVKTVVVLFAVALLIWFLVTFAFNNEDEKVKELKTFLCDPSEASYNHCMTKVEIQEANKNIERLSQILSQLASDYVCRYPSLANDILSVEQAQSRLGLDDPSWDRMLRILSHMALPFYGIELLDEDKKQLHIDGSPSDIAFFHKASVQVSPLCQAHYFMQQMYEAFWDRMFMVLPYVAVGLVVAVLVTLVFFWRKWVWRQALEMDLVADGLTRQLQQYPDEVPVTELRGWARREFPKTAKESFWTGVCQRVYDHAAEVTVSHRRGRGEMWRWNRA